ncbi:leucine-rich repeat domain-containing protein, partial [Leptospira borgpetersenii]
MNLTQTNLQKIFLFSLLFFCSFTFVQAEQPGTYYKALTKALQNPLDVRVLDLREQKLTILPKEIWQLKNLRELRLDNNQLTTLPKEIGLLQNLKILHLYAN